jgi:hypothetical protein
MDASDHEHGYEDPLLLGLSELSQRYLYMLDNSNKGLSNMEEFGHFFAVVRSNDFLRQEWCELRRRGQPAAAFSAVVRRILDFLDTCLDLGDARFQETMAAMTALASPQKEAALWTVFLGLGHQALRTCNDEIRFRPALPVRLEDQAIDAGVFFGKISEEWLALRRHIVVDLRNDFMARNLVKVYAVAREKGPPLVVVVGANHGEGLKALLERQLGPQVRILTRDSREAFKALFESPSPARSVAILQRHYGACRPERHGFRTVLAIAERSCGFFLTDAGQKIYRLVGCPKTLTTEQVAFGGPQISGSDWPENELRPLAEPLHGHGMHQAIPCVIL